MPYFVLIYFILQYIWSQNDDNEHLQYFCYIVCVQIYLVIIHMCFWIVKKQTTTTLVKKNIIHDLGQSSKSLSVTFSVYHIAALL